MAARHRAPRRAPQVPTHSSQDARRRNRAAKTYSVRTIGDLGALGVPALPRAPSRPLKGSRRLAAVAPIIGPLPLRRIRGASKNFLGAEQRLAITQAKAWPRSRSAASSGVTVLPARPLRSAAAPFCRLARRRSKSAVSSRTGQVDALGHCFSGEPILPRHGTGPTGAITSASSPGGPNRRHFSGTQSASCRPHQVRNSRIIPPDPV